MAASFPQSEEIDRLGVRQTIGEEGEMGYKFKLRT